MGESEPWSCQGLSPVTSVVAGWSLLMEVRGLLQLSLASSNGIAPLAPQTKEWKLLSSLARLWGLHTPWDSLNPAHTSVNASSLNSSVRPF